MSSTPVDRLVSVLERTQPTRPKAKSSTTSQKKRKPRSGKPNKTATQRMVQTLTEARQLIEIGWVRHEIAVDENGKACEADSPHASAWCMSGALQAASYKVGFPGTANSTRRIEQAAKLILDANGLHPHSNQHVISAVAEHNDKLATKEQVLDALDKALAQIQ